MQNFIMRPSKAFTQRLGFLLLVCALIGCSAIRLGYSNGESVAYWWLNNYVDIGPEQQPWVRRHIRDLFAWHRTTQLQDYARLLAQGQQRLQQNVTQPMMQADYDAIKKRVMTVVDKALPRLTDLALSLEPEQIAHLEKKFASNNESYRKDYLRGDLEKRQLFRFKKVMKQAEYWFGNFSEEQEKQIRAASDARPLNNELWMAMRVQRQQEMLALLKRIQAEKPNRDTAMRMLRDYVDASLDHFGNAQHKAFADASQEGTVRMVTQIINIATPAQKEHAMKRLQQWIADIEALTTKGT